MKFEILLKSTFMNCPVVLLALIFIKNSLKIWNFIE